MKVHGIQEITILMLTKNGAWAAAYKYLTK